MNGYSTCYVCGDRKSINTEMIFVQFVDGYICHKHGPQIAQLIEALKVVHESDNPADGIREFLSMMLDVIEGEALV